MHFSFKQSQVASLALALVASLTAHAQPAPDLQPLLQELRQLRAEVETLKRERNPAPSAAVAASPQAAVPAASTPAPVVQGDLPNSFKLPGTNTSVRLYGALRTDAVHDFKATAPGDLFNNLPEQPLDGTGAQTGRSFLTVQATRLGVRTSTPTAGGAMATRLETDFYAYCGESLNGNACNRGRMRIRHAYGEYAGWLIGQTFSTFMDSDTLPDTVDLIGPIGAPALRRPMVRYTVGTPGTIRFSAALEDPNRGARTPDLVARLDKSFGSTSVNLRLLTAETRSAAGYARRGHGIGLGASIEPTSRDSVVLQLARVDGSAALMWGSNGSADTGSQIVLDRSDNLNLGWTHRFSDRLRANAIVGWTRSRADAEFVAAYGANDANRQLHQFYLNAFYAPIPNVELGAEYTWGKRKTFSDDTGTLSRINLMGKYSF